MTVYTVPPNALLPPTMQTIVLRRLANQCEVTAMDGAYMIDPARPIAVCARKNCQYVWQTMDQHTCLTPFHRTHKLAQTCLQSVEPCP